MVLILFTCMTSWTGNTCIITQFFVFFFWQEGTGAKNIAQRKEKAFPFLIFTGTLDLLGKIYIAADQQILCCFEASMVEAALALFATYYVFMFNYPPGLTNFYLFYKNVYYTFRMAKSCHPPWFHLWILFMNCRGMGNGHFL